MPPLILHRTSAAESHFHPTDGIRPILIHTHSSGPFIASEAENEHAVNLDIYSSGECGISQLELTVDWWSSLGTWGLRYWTTVCAWAIGVVAITILQAWDAWDEGGLFVPVQLCIDVEKCY
jgi:GPI inositol-deacylase